MAVFPPKVKKTSQYQIKYYPDNSVYSYKYMYYILPTS